MGFVFAKPPRVMKNLKGDINFIFPLATFEFAVASACRAYEPHNELELANRALDYTFERSWGVTKPTTLQSLFGVLEWWRS